jgi:16S rRNA processing protein RimM
MVRNVRQVGTITRPHGVRGEVKVRPESDDPARLVALQTVYLGRSAEEAVAYTVRAAFTQPLAAGIAVVYALDGVGDREAAAGLHGQEVFALESDLPPLEEDEVFLSDLVGCSAVDADGSPIGDVVEVLDLPGQHMLVIRTSSGEEVMVPFVDAFVSDVDLEQRRIVITPVEGLLDPSEQETAE